MGFGDFPTKCQSKPDPLRFCGVEGKQGLLQYLVTHAAAAIRNAEQLAVYIGLHLQCDVFGLTAGFARILEKIQQCLLYLSRVKVSRAGG